MTKDQKLIEIACKEFLMNIVKESEILNEKLSFFQKTLMYDRIREMSYNEILSLLINNGKKITTEQKEEFESKTKKIAKYGAAGYVGRKIGMRAIGKAPIKVLGKKVMSGGKKTQKIGLLGTKGGIRGALGAVAGLYLFRKLSDPCVRHNIGDSKGQAACKLEACKKVINQIKSDMSRCNKTENPTKCKSKLNSELIKWQTRYQQYLIQKNTK